MPRPGKIDILIPTLNQTPVIDSYPAICHVLTSRLSPLSEARKDLIKTADTEWVLFLDDDVLFGYVKLLEMSEYIKPSIGMIESNVEGEFHRTGPANRAWLGFTLVRREAALDWNPPPMRGYEDEHLRRHIHSRGYDTVTAFKVNVLHAREREPSFIDYYDDGIGARDVLTDKEKLWMFLKTPLMLRHGFRRFRFHIYFLYGMWRGQIIRYEPPHR